MGRSAREQHVVRALHSRDRLRDGRIDRVFEDSPAADTNRANDETSAQADALEERIRVLERIVTENKFDLRREIDRL